ncbi:MAG: hypothetical protein AAGF11_51015 [Myxococcota bacterium]
MPRVMRWLLIALVVQLVVDLVVLVWGEPAESAQTAALEWGALVVDSAVVVMLSRATELTRVLIRTAAGVGLSIDGWILWGVLMWAPHDPAGITALVTSAGLVTASAFAWIVLGRDDVKAWVFGRWLRRAEGTDGSSRVTC